MVVGNMLCVIHVYMRLLQILILKSDRSEGYHSKYDILNKQLHSNICSDKSVEQIIVIYNR